MKKRLSFFVCLVMLLSALTLPLYAATTHTVVAGGQYVAHRR